MPGFGVQFMLLQKITKKISYVVASLVLMTAQLTPFFVFGGQASATSDVTICHALGQENKDEWQKIEVDKSAIDGQGGNGDHNRDGHQSGEDIIPPTYTDGTLGSWVSRNWDAEGQAIWNNGCNVPSGSIKIIKDAQPNSNDDFSFEFNVVGTSNGDDDFILDDNSSESTSNNGKKSSRLFDYLKAASTTYEITEDYDSDWVLFDIICVGGGNNTTVDVSNRKATVVLDKDEDVICTFVNKPKPETGSVKVNKMVDTDGNGSYDGGNTTANNIGFMWGLDAEPTDNAMGSTQTNVATGSHTVTENIVSGYEFKGWYYTDNYDDRGDHQENCNHPRGTILPVNVIVSKNSTKEITLCNKKIPTGTLVMIKEVETDNGGTATQNLWTLNANGPESVSGVDSTSSTDSGYSTDVTTGKYVFSETNGPDGYELEYIKCKSGYGDWVSLDSKKEFEVIANKTTVCVFKNNDKKPSLTLVKEVKNSNKPASSWTLTANGNRQDSTDLSGNGSVSSSSNFKADTYTLGESGPSGFDASPWTCTNGVTVNGNNQITLGLGQTTTCTIVNTAKPVTVIATKIVCDEESSLPGYGNGGPDITSTSAIDWVTNNSGCKLTEGWNFEYAFNNATNPGDNSGDTVWENFGPTNVNGQTSKEFSDISNIDKIWIREQLKDGYLGFTYNIAGNNNNTISAEIYCNKDVLNYDNYDFIDNLSAGNPYYCVAWNVQKAVIRVHKEVINDNGGNKDAEDFEFEINEQDKQNFAPQGNYVEFVVYSGDYLIEETDSSGYEASYKGCEITAEPGQTYNCYVTNDDKPGKVTYKKVTSVNSDQKFSFTDSNGFFGLSNGGSKESTNLSAGSVFTVTEEIPEGWKLLPVQCTNSDSWSQIENGVSVNVNVGDDVTCTFYNQKLSSISGYKLDDANGNAEYDDGEKKIPNWTIELYERCNPRDEVSVFALVLDDEIIEECFELIDTTLTDDEGNYTFLNLESGYYKVCEVQKEGWTRTYPVDSDCHKQYIDEDCTMNFANTADPEEPSTPEVLGNTTTSTPPVVLATTGDSQSSYMFATGLTLIATTLVVATNRRREIVSTK
jgi:LPXTG-motif cell wall-anchored protein